MGSLFYWQRNFEIIDFSQYSQWFPKCAFVINLEPRQCRLLTGNLSTRSSSVSQLLVVCAEEETEIISAPTASRVGNRNLEILPINEGL